MESVRVRFAPSPTGMFHIGSARTALFNWLYARHTGGTFILRIEDTDAARNKPEYVEVIFQALQWLGLDWDEGPQPGVFKAEDAPSGLCIYPSPPYLQTRFPYLWQKGEKGPYFQSQRAAKYKNRVDQLLTEGKAYELDGAIKFRTPKTPITVSDLVCGNIQFDRTNEPDLVIQRKDGSPVFHLVNVVDDIEMEITHVIRGEDHLSNTPKHLALFEALGAKPPHYAHIPLILNPNGSKMSKRDAGASIAEYEEQGYLPEAVRNYLCLLGWSPKDNREVFPIEEVIEKFDLPQVGRSNAHFDLNKLFWINGEHFRNKDSSPLASMAIEIMKRKNLWPENADEAFFRAGFNIIKEKIKGLRDVPDWMGYFLTEDFKYDEEAKKKVFTPEGLANLAKLRERLKNLDEKNFTATDLENEFKALAAVIGQKVGALIHPARLAVSGRSVGPSLYHLLEVLGKARTLSRMERAEKECGSTH